MLDCQQEVPGYTPSPNGVYVPNPKQLYGDRKVQLGLVPPAAIIYIALALQEGARKYGAYNWRTQPVELMTYKHAMERHMAAWQDGQDGDIESFLPHLGHAGASLAIMIDSIESNCAIDNRPPPGGAAGLLLRYQKQ